MGTISLCVIAKDEAEMLPGLFASVRGAVDEVVFVDTGSRDETVRIATECGARIVHHIWMDDFAAARNCAVQEARGDWVLVLDCDERLAPGSAAALREAADRGDFELGMLPLYNATRSDATAEEILSGAARDDAPTLLPRFFKRDDSLRWEGRVHEGVTTWLTHGNKRVVELPVAILHLGNAADVVQAKDKLRRNLNLLVRRCAEEPDNPVMWSHLARVLLRDGQAEEAWQAAQKGWAALIRARNGGDLSYSVAPLVTVVAFLALQRGEESLALQVIRQAAIWGVSHPNLRLLEGISYETQALSQDEGRSESLAAAGDAFEAALRMGTQTWTEDCMPGATGWAAYTRLGTVRLLQDRWVEAQQAFSQALQEKPEHVEARLGIVEALLGQEEPAQALQVVEPLLSLDAADPWILAAFATRNLGQVEDCRLFLKLAVQRIENGLYAPHRRVYVHQLECDLAALAG